MQHQIDYVFGVRQTILRGTRNFDNKQLNEIPRGFQNNLIWHMAHVAVSIQDFFYSPLGLEMNVDPEIYFDFRIGTTPKKIVSDEKIALIKQLVVKSVSDLEDAFKNGLFTNFPQLDEVVNHFVFHEGMHLAYILSIRRLLVYQ
jgi:hypothetical protein